MEDLERLNREEGGGIVTVDLELMGITLEEYFAGPQLDPIAAAFQGRLVHHRTRLLYNEPGLLAEYVERCERLDLPWAVASMTVTQCTRALYVLEDLARAVGKRDPRTNWQFIQ